MKNRTNDLKKIWMDAIGAPQNYFFEKQFRIVRKIHHADFEGELSLQACGPNTFQKLLKFFPKNPAGPLPAVAVPFYHPDGMTGMDLETMQPLEKYWNITMAVDLVRRGFATATADAYPFHFEADSPFVRTEPFHCPFSWYTRPLLWPTAGEKIQREHPEWTGIGKLVSDTMLLIDSLASDPRIDCRRIGIAGHSLGGKMAFYTGCLDSRVKAILASDFGMGWDSTNWSDTWYWGDKVESLKKAGLEHSQLLTISGGKPFMLLAGEADTEASGEMMRRAEGYDHPDEKLVFLNHASGHRPPPEALEQGYCFLEKWI